MIIQIEHLGFQPLRILCCDAEIVANYQQEATYHGSYKPNNRM